MNKAELILHLAEACQISKKQAEDVVEEFVRVVTETLQKGGEVNIAGFGAFLAKTRKGRMGVNPQNPKEPMQIPSVTVAKFKPGKGLKEALKGSPAAAPAPAPMPAPAPAPMPALEPPAPPAPPAPPTM